MANPYRNPSYFWRIFLLSAFFFILGCAPVERAGISSAQARRLGGVTVPTNLSMGLFEVPWPVCDNHKIASHQKEKKQLKKSVKEKVVESVRYRVHICIFDCGRKSIENAHQCRRYQKCVKGKSVCCLQWPPANVTIKSSRLYII